MARRLGGLLLVILAAAVIFPNAIFRLALSVPPRVIPRSVQCQSNLKNIGTALEMYKTDHESFPAELVRLTPNYLRTLPTCPSADRETYSESLAVQPDAYTVWCQGHHHAAVDYEPNYPRYTSSEGLIKATPAHAKKLQHRKQLIQGARYLVATLLLLLGLWLLLQQPKPSE